MYGEFFLVSVITRIDAYFLDVFGRFHRCRWKEMDIGDKWYLAFCGANFFRDFSQSCGSSLIRRSNTNDLTSRLGKREGLSDCSINVLRLRSRHRLDADWIVSANVDATDINRSRGAATGLKSRIAIKQIGCAGACHHYNNLKMYRTSYPEEGNL